MHHQSSHAILGTNATAHSQYQILGKLPQKLSTDPTQILQKHGQQNVDVLKQQMKKGARN